uniref:Uncharacterized protein n=1 Tax=Arundo donax TaxID=35708 RepID=A0A0A9GRD5_ARUDO
MRLRGTNTSPSCSCTRSTASRRSSPSVPCIVC